MHINQQDKSTNLYIALTCTLLLVCWIYICSKAFNEDWLTLLQFNYHFKTTAQKFEMGLIKIKCIGKFS